MVLLFVQLPAGTALHCMLAVAAKPLQVLSMSVFDLLLPACTSFLKQVD
jgi:hypothetical protein